MNSVEFAKVFEKQIERCRDILFQKAEEYATDDERLHNFNAGAAISGETPAQVLSGYMLKHTISVYHMVSADDPTTFSNDKWDEKITDHINYLILLRAILDEAFDKLPNTTERESNQ